MAGEAALNWNNEAPPPRWISMNGGSMKRLLKAVAIFALGAAIGCAVTGFVVNKFHRGQLAWIRASQVGVDALLAQLLREGNAQIVLESADRRLIDGVLDLHRSDDVKNLYIAEISLTAAKRYYVCTKMEYPSEIASIMNNLPPVPESECRP
jgi:hypothetical protein